MTEHPASDSDWSRLDASGRDDHLRQLVEQLLDGQTRGRHRVSGLALEVKLQGEAVRKLTDRMEAQEKSLDANTAITQRTEAKIDTLTTNTATMVSLFGDAEALFRITNRIVEFLKKLAWVTIPFVTAIGAYKAVAAWLKGFGA